MIEYVNIPSFGAASWRAVVPTVFDLPSIGNTNGDVIVTQDTDTLYIWNGSAWESVTGSSVTTVTASSPLVSSGGQTPNISIPPATTLANGYLIAADWNTFNNKQPAGSYVLTTRQINTTAPLTGGGTLSSDLTLVIPQSSASVDGYLSQTDWSTFNNKAPINSPTFTGIPAAPTAGAGTSTTQLATTAFVQSQGFLTSTGSIPTGEQDNATAATSATTTFVNALTTTVTLTQTAPILAVANATFTTTTAASVAGLRITINAVAGRTALITLTALATDYLGAIHFISASLAPGVYTVNFDFQRSSGTGTVNYVSGTLIAEGLQGTNSNGITQLTGALQAGPGSGSQVLSGVLPVANGGTHLSATTINQLLYSSATNVIAGLATTNTGALVTNSAGVPSITSGAAANTTLRSNGTTVAFGKTVLTSDVSGTLPFGNGGTGSTSIASGRVPFSNGTALITDGQFLYDTTNNRLTVGTGGGTGTLNVVPVTSSLGLNVYSQTGNHAIQVQNQAAEAIELINASAGGPTNGVHTRASQSRGTLTARTQSMSGDNVWDFSTLGYTGTTFGTNSSAGMTVILSENYTATNQGADMFFSTALNGTSSGAVERVRIKNSGETVFQGAVATARMSTATKNALTPAGGWVVFDTTLNQLSYYNGTVWVNL